MTPCTFIISMRKLSFFSSYKVSKFETRGFISNTTDHFHRFSSETNWLAPVTRQEKNVSVRVIALAFSEVNQSLSADP